MVQVLPVEKAEDYEHVDADDEGASEPAYDRPPPDNYCEHHVNDKAAEKLAVEGEGFDGNFAPVWLKQ